MKKSPLQVFVESLSELLLSSYVLMLLFGALGASLEWGTLSYLQTLGALYTLKTIVASATATYYYTIVTKLKSDAGLTK